MSVLSVKFGDSEGRARAKLALQQAQDRLMELDEGETKDLAFHVSKEAERTKVVLTTLRVQEETILAKANQNMGATIAIGVVLLLKGIVSLQDVGNFLAWLGAHI